MRGLETMVQVLLVEDSRLSREAIEARLARSGRYRVWAAMENAANAEIACMGGRVELVLMDVCTADDESGLKAAARIKKHSPDIRVVIMTSMPEHSFRQKALAAGCEGFWYKEHGDADLLEVCDRVMAGETVYPAEGPSVRVGWADSRDFTARELEILRELALGRRYEAIAGDLGISPNTVKYHVKNLLQKTGYETAMQLIADVVEKRLVLPKY